MSLVNFMFFVWSDRPKGPKQCVATMSRWPHPVAASPRVDSYYYICDQSILLSVRASRPHNAVRVGLSRFARVRLLGFWFRRLHVACDRTSLAQPQVPNQIIHCPFLHPSYTSKRTVGVPARSQFRVSPGASPQQLPCWRHLLEFRDVSGSV